MDTVTARSLRPATMRSIRSPVAHEQRAAIVDAGRRRRDAVAARCVVHVDARAATRAGAPARATRRE